MYNFGKYNDYLPQHKIISDFFQCDRLIGEK